VLRLEAH